MNTLAVVGLSHFKDALLNYQSGDIAMESTEEIVSRLKFIGLIQKEEKINVRQVNRQPNNLMTKLSRTVLYPDNRTNTYKFIKDVIMRAFEIIDHQIFQNNYLFCRGIVADLARSKNGMMNLKYTYAGDTKFCCDMDVLIEQVNSKLIILRDKFPLLFENDDEKLSAPKPISTIKLPLSSSAQGTPGTPSVTDSPPLRPMNPFELDKSGPKQ